MKKQRSHLPFKIGSLLFIGLFIILLGGYYSYRNLNEVITLLSQNNVPTAGLTTLEKLTGAIEEAEISVKQYVAVNSQYSFKKYQQKIESIDSKP